MVGMIPLLEIEALGTHWWIRVFEPLDPVVAASLTSRLRETISTFQRRYTRFEPTSLVGRLNQGELLTGFPGELYEMALWGEKLREISGGYFTLGIGAVLGRLGYDERYSFAATGTQALQDGSPFAALAPGRIRMAEGSSLDLGGIGKGWLIDRLSGILRAAGLSHFSVNGGGDIYATSDGGKPIRYALENPFDDGQEIGQVPVLNAAIAASGSQKRRWQDRQTGALRHHLVDPFAGESSWLRAAAFTWAGTARAADAASTVLYLVPEEMVATIASALEVEYLLVSPDGATLCSPQYPGLLNS